MARSPKTEEKKVLDGIEKLRNNPLLFAETFLKDPSNPKKKFKARWNQKPILENHGHRLNTVRAQRSCGKTICIMALILHFAITQPYKVILVVGPYKMTVQRVFEELVKQINESELLQGSVVASRKNPFELVFSNGSIVRGQSTNVTSKRGGQMLRGEHPHFIYIDEADYLDEADWKSFGPLLDPSDLNTVPPIVYATTTPTGKREIFFELCEHKDGDKARGKDWKDWWFPAKHLPKITFEGAYTTDSRGFFIPKPDAKIFCSAVNPDWDKDRDDRQRRLLLEQGYLHEIMAWWGSATSSVFPKSLIDEARKKGIKHGYTYLKTREFGKQQFFTGGVDVDRVSASPNICIIEYIPNPSKADGTQGTYVVRFREEMERQDRIYVAMRFEVNRLNNEFKPQVIYMDRGYGDVSVEELNNMGLLNVIGKWFRENATIVNPATDQVEQKPLKHVMISMAQRLFEDGRIILPPMEKVSIEYDDMGKSTVKNEPQWDDKFIHDLVNYQVVNVTKTGVPEYTSKYDHTIASFLLALWAAIETFDNPYEIAITSGFLATPGVELQEKTNLFGGRGAKKAPKREQDREQRYTESSLDEFVSITQQKYPSRFPIQRTMVGGERRSF